MHFFSPAGTPGTGEGVAAAGGPMSEADPVNVALSRTNNHVLRIGGDLRGRMGPER